jgi:hypothetical protein
MSFYSIRSNLKIWAGRAETGLGEAGRSTNGGIIRFSGGNDGSVKKDAWPYSKLQKKCGKGTEDLLNLPEGRLALQGGGSSPCSPAQPSSRKTYAERYKGSIGVNQNNYPFLGTSINTRL